MEVNSDGLIIIGVFCQGLMHLEEIEQHLEEAELLQVVHLTVYLEKNFMSRWKIT